MTTVCGWCITSEHEKCKPSITYYDKTWYCTCTVCHPQQQEDPHE